MPRIWFYAYNLLHATKTDNSLSDMLLPGSASGTPAGIRSGIYGFRTVTPPEVSSSGPKKAVWEVLGNTVRGWESSGGSGGDAIGLGKSLEARRGLVSGRGAGN